MYAVNWRLCHPVNIYVFRNGVEGASPVLVHIPSDKKRSMEAVLKTIGDRLKFSIGYPFALYQMSGCKVCETYELETHAHYVVATNLDKHFKYVCYGESRPPMVVVGPKSKNVRNIGNTMKDILRISNKENTKMKYVLASTVAQDGFGPTELPYLTQPSRECGALCQKIKYKLTTCIHESESLCESSFSNEEVYYLDCRKYSCFNREPCDKIRLKYLCCPTPEIPPKRDPEPEEQCCYNFDGVEYRKCECNERGDTDAVEWCKSELCNYTDPCGTIETECTGPEQPNPDNVCPKTTIDPCCRMEDICVQPEENFCERKKTPPPPTCDEPIPQEIPCVKKDLPTKPLMSHASVNTEPYVADVVGEPQPECVVKIVNRKLDIGGDLYRMFNCRLLSDNPHPIPKSSCKTASQPAKDTRVSDDFYRKFYDKLNESMSQPFESADIEAEFVEDTIPTIMVEEAVPLEVPVEEEQPRKSNDKNNFTMPLVESTTPEEDKEPDQSEPTTNVGTDDEDGEYTDIPDRDEILAVIDEILSSATDRANSASADYQTDDEASYVNTTSVEETDTSFTVEESSSAATIEALRKNKSQKDIAQSSVPPPRHSNVEDYGVPPDNLTGESISAILGTVLPDTDDTQPRETRRSVPTTEPANTGNINNPSTYFMTLHQMNNPFRISSDGHLQVHKFPCALPLTQFPVHGTPYGDFFPRGKEKLKNYGNLTTGAVCESIPSSTTKTVHLQSLFSSDEDIDYIPQELLDELRKPILTNSKLGSKGFTSRADKNTGGEKRLQNKGMLTGTVGKSKLMSTTNKLGHMDNLKTRPISSDDDIDYIPQAYLDELSKPTLTHPKLGSQDTTPYTNNNKVVKCLISKLPSCQTNTIYSSQSFNSQSSSYTQLPNSLYDTYSSSLISSDSETV